MDETPEQAQAADYMLQTPLDFKKQQTHFNFDPSEGSNYKKLRDIKNQASKYVHHKQGSSGLAPVNGYHSGHQSGRPSRGPSGRNTPSRKSVPTRSGYHSKSNSNEQILDASTMVNPPDTFQNKIINNNEPKTNGADPRKENIKVEAQTLEGRGRKFQLTSKK